MTLNHAGTRRLNAEIAGARGQLLFPEDFQVASVPDEENAAYFLRRAFENFHEEALSYDSTSWDELHEYPLTAKALESLRAYIRANQECLHLIHRARQCTRVDWKYAPRLGTSDAHRQMAEYMNIILRLNNLAQLLGEATSVQVASGNDAGAIASLRDALGMARAVHQGPFTMSHIVAISIEGNTASACIELAPGISGASPTPRPVTTAPILRSETQSLIAELLEENDRSLFAARALLCERAATISLLDPTPSSVFLSYNDGSGAKRDPPPPLVRKMLLPYTKLRTAEVFHLLTLSAEAEQDANWPTAKKRMPPPPVRPRMPGLPLTNWLPPPQYTFRSGQYKFQTAAVRRLAAVRLAIWLYQHDHSRLPPDLKSLVPDYLPFVPDDPYAASKQPLGYAAHANFPFIYSVWNNGADDVATGFVPVSKDQYSNRAPDLIFFLDLPAMKAAEKAANKQQK